MALLGAGKSVAAGRRRRRRRAARAAGALVARRRRPAEARPGVCNLGRGATGGDRCLASGVRAGARGARGGTALAGGGLSASDLEPGASPRRSRTGCPGRARSRRRLWRPWIRPAGRRAALAAEAPRRLGRRERRLAWGEVEGGPATETALTYLEAAWVTWRASLIPFTLPRPHSSAEARKVLSPFRGIRADTCYLVYKAHGRFDRAQKGRPLLGL